MASSHRGTRARGFTLVESMIVLALLGILLSLAVPSYTRFIQDIRREDGRHLLLLNAQRLQRCFTLGVSYDGVCHTRPTSDEGHYRLETDLGTTSYSLRAVPVTGGAQARDAECGTLTYDHTGARGATGERGAACW